MSFKSFLGNLEVFLGWTTEKDFCRIGLDSNLKGFNIEYLKVRLEIENKDKFIELIKEKI